MGPLTQEQKELVEKNHNLIYGLANKYKIDLDEYYGVLAIGLCKAAQLYDSSRGKFSPLAYKVMLTECFMEWRKQFTKKSVPKDKLVPLDKKVRDAGVDNGRDSLAFAEIIPDTRVDVEGSVLNNICYEEMMEFIDSLKGRNDREIVEMLMIGMSQGEIGNALHETKSSINQKVAKIRKHIRKNGKMLE